IAAPGTPNTPIRAKASTLVTRSSPSVPAASQNYEPVVKSTLRYRLQQAGAQAAAVCWATQSIWMLWQRGGFYEMGLSGFLVTPFRPMTLLGALLLWLATFAPIVWLRKIFLTAQRTSATSPRASLAAAMTKASTKPAAIICATSSFAIAVWHAMFATWFEQEDPKLGVFVKSRKHPHYLNGRLMLLVVSQLVVTGSFLFRNMLRDRFAFRWVSMSSTAPPAWFSVAMSFVISLVSITSSLPLACIIFGAIRMLVLPILFQLPLIHTFLRPFAYHFLRGPVTLALPFLHLPLLARAWFVGLTTFFLWEVSETLFDGSVSEPVPVTGSKSNPTANQTLLVSGISSNDLIMKYFAYAELSGIVHDRTPSALAERQALFGDQKNVPNLWGAFVRETLLLLGQDYQRLLRRGAPAPAPAPGPAPLTTKQLLEGMEDRVHATPAPLLRRSILRSSVKTEEPLLDTLSSDGPVARIVEDAAGKAQKAAEYVHLPDLFKSVSAKAAEVTPPVVAKTEQAVVTATANPRGLVQRIVGSVTGAIMNSYEKNAPPQLKDEVENFMVWWTGERVSRLVDASLPMRELDVVVIEVLTRLVCASLAEDRYGTVQRDIPKIIEALLSFLTAVEDYRAEIVSNYSPPPLPQPEVDEDGQEQPPRKLTRKELETRRAIEAELEKATDVLGYVGDGLKDGIARIVGTFGDRLTAFRFPARTAYKLQEFMDFCA
ncbi:nucleoporin protein Ndc1-Nup, partial [Coprinopsis sp. MPI-PUGE-AT-0042]